MTHIAGIIENDTANAPNNNYKVYCYTNKINGKKYIGQTKFSLQERAKDDGKGYKKCRLFWKAIEKYGWDNFSSEILIENLTLEEASYWENYYIKLYKTYVDFTDCNGYNLTLGDTSYERSEQTRKKNSESQKKRFSDNPVTQATKEKQSLSHKKYFESERIKEKYRKIMIERWKNEDYKNFQKNIATGGKNSQAKKVICIEQPDIIFETISEASKWCNDGKDSLRSHIKQQAEGKRKSCGKHPVTGVSLHWRYIDEDSRDNIK